MGAIEWRLNGSEPDAVRISVDAVHTGHNPVVRASLCRCVVGGMNRAIGEVNRGAVHFVPATSQRCDPT